MIPEWVAAARASNARTHECGGREPVRQPRGNLWDSVLGEFGFKRYQNIINCYTDLTRCVYFRAAYSGSKVVAADAWMRGWLKALVSVIHVATLTSTTRHQRC